ncbi:MAG: hypothetical protein ACKPA9_09345 [Microcystis sp.]
MPTLQTLYTICDRTIAAKKDEDETKNIIGNDDEVHKGSQLPVSFNISIW